jgi:uroporphyrin-III C-methyltransferase
MTLLPKVTLIGAGPGDPDLLTLKAYKALQSAQVVLYDHLVSDDVLSFLPKSVELIYVGKESSRHTMPQDEIAQVMIRLAQSGKHVIRLKGGDCYIFGRGGEEVEALVEAGVPYEVIPGITAAQGAGAMAGIPLTHRDYSRALVLATGHLRQDKVVDLDWNMLSRPKQTVVIYMGVGTLPVICEQLMAHGLPNDTPAALIENATLPHQRTVAGTLQQLPELAKSERVRPPALIVIGEVVALHEKLSQVLEETLSE